MKYFSTNKNSPLVSFKEATIKGQAPDKGLYFPETIPTVQEDLIHGIEKLSNEEIAWRVMKPFTGDEIPDDKLFQIVSETINFPIPLVKVNDSISSLELFHGPTLAFKDVGARFMSRCLGHFLKNEDRKVTVLVATSGDTGGAVANGFYDVKGVEVIILYPSRKVSPVQEKQLATLGKNIHALEIEGTFDDCQQMVKEAFMDAEIKEKLFLTSANSINIARWLPQQFYYFLAYKQWADKGNPPVISVPSGNFGNICAGLLAKHSGLPVQHFVAACNANDMVPNFLQTIPNMSLWGNFKTRRAVSTLSNAMDVGDPSNFVRILEIFNHEFNDLKKGLSSFSITDVETVATIKEVFEQHNYILDPHGAVGYLALQKYLAEHNNTKGIFLETAHPVKFPAAVVSVTGKVIEVPESIAAIMDQETKSTMMQADFSFLKEYLLK
ncbi:MAG TPA: threonine synthase [Chitinophagaceae bacterium]|nr:threonine synthase [Chitinophagaceae bacterium]